MLDILKAILFGIVEGITEWLPVSSTGHLILLEEFIKMDVSKEFWNLFLVVIQLGAILASVILFWNKIWPFQKPNKAEGKSIFKVDTWMLLFKVGVACIPGVIFAVLGVDDICDKYFYNGVGVALALIIFGVIFILVENWNKKRTAKYNDLADLTFQLAIYIGLFQLLAAAFPGTSRSGATIIGALVLGVSRTAASEFTFILAIPAMLGASLLELKDYLELGMTMGGTEIAILLVGVIVSFIVSVVVIKFLMGYIKKHDFKVFGWYRIVLGVIVFLYFALFA
ncbi:MAG: undecaprenyl-diphosphate phosphatase [Lachnospiraceae bacterium]|nr:undecaprenyl-diphosphate phosphatase [Lachnospiraceae bacterium]